MTTIMVLRADHDRVNRALSLELRSRVAHVALLKALGQHEAEAFHPSLWRKGVLRRPHPNSNTARRLTVWLPEGAYSHAVNLGLPIEMIVRSAIGRATRAVESRFPLLTPLGAWRLREASRAVQDILFQQAAGDPVEIVQGSLPKCLQDLGEI